MKYHQRGLVSLPVLRPYALRLYIGEVVWFRITYPMSGYVFEVNRQRG